MNEPTLQVFGARSQNQERRELTVREYADYERVTARTVWNWIEKKAVPYRKTPGGGIRIVVTENR